MTAPLSKENIIVQLLQAGFEIDEAYEEVDGLGHSTTIMFKNGTMFVTVHEILDDEETDDDTSHV